MAKRRSWEGLGLGAIVLVVVALGFFIASRFVSPAPPRTIQMATGPKGGAYEMFARGYAQSLRRHGIKLEIQRTSGSVENLSLLRSGQADVALVQTGIVDPDADPTLRSLGSLFHEPLWLFLRAGTGIELLGDLRGRRIDVGPDGSGTRALATRVLKRNDVSQADSEWLALSEVEQDAALSRGQLDAIFTVGSVNSPTVRALLANPRLRLQEIERAEAYTRIDRSLTRVVLPEGVMDLSKNIPAHDTVLLSAMGELLIAERLHPALIDIVLQAAADVHQRGDIFSEPGSMPSARWVDVPLSKEAVRYFQYGPPFLQRYLPFWAATQIDRLKVMLIPVLALLIPLVRVFPPTYRWRVRSRIYRWYRELQQADLEPGVEFDTQDMDRRLETVARIEREVGKVPTPPSYAAELYALRLHIDFVKGGLEAVRAGEAASRQ